MSRTPDYYELLGLPRDASPGEIRRAYHEAASRFHPDVNKQTGALEQFLQIQRVFDILADPHDRSEYDKNLAAEPGGPIACHILFSRKFIPLLDEAQTVYALIEYQPLRALDPKFQPSMNVCLVIDRSSSMQGERMDTVKASAIELIRNLKPGDSLSIVAFSDRAEVLASANRQVSQSRIEKEISMLKAAGGTEIFNGLSAGLDELLHSSRRHRVNQIVLITDGQTYGDEEKCLKLADSAANLGVRISCLGIGPDWNDRFLDELAARSGGHTTYIPKPKNIEKIIKNKFLSFQRIFAENATLHIETRSGVSLSYAYRLHPETGALPTTSPIHLGAIPMDSKLSILLEFILQPVKVGTSLIQLATGALNSSVLFDPPGEHREPLHLYCPTGQAPLCEIPPQPIFQSLAHISLYRLQERARREYEAGDLDQASLHLKRLAAQLTAIGENELAKSALHEADNIKKTRLLSPEGSKHIKFGTRALSESALERGGVQ